MEIKDWPVSVIIIVVGIVAIFIYFTLEAVRTPGFEPILLFFPFILFFWALLTIWGEYLIIHYCKNFISLDGKIGAVVSGPSTVAGGEEEYVVAMPKRYIPLEERFRLGGLKGAAMVFSARYNMRVRRPADLFEEISNDVEGAVLLYDTIDKSRVPLKKFDARLLDKVKEQSFTISRMANQIDEARAVADMLSQSSNKEILDAAEKISAVFKHIERPVVVEQAGPYRPPRVGEGGV